MPLLTTTAYFSPLDWYRAAPPDDTWVWEGHETYQKGGWRNRCRIATANGPLLLTVPLLGGKHQQMPIREVRIDHRTDWQRQHAQTIRSAYGRAPYFEHYGDAVLDLLLHKRLTLWDFNHHLAQGIINLLHLPTTLSTTNTFRGGAAGTVNVGKASTPYRQVFEERHGFLPGLSVLDGIFCLGPELLVGGLESVE